MACSKRRSTVPSQMELSLKDVVNELNPVAPKYFCIGLNLDVPGDKIRTIESNHTETNRRFLEVLISIWMKGRRELVTWERLIKALEAPSVDEQSLADKVRNKIYTPANSQDSAYESQQDPKLTPGPAIDTQQSSSLSIASSIALEPPPLVKPLYKPGYDTPELVWETLRKFDYSSFRPDQERAIMNILSGVSTLVILPVASGKSLCYQIPAYIYAQHSHCVTLVISPFISLIQDQIRNLPSQIKGALLRSEETSQRNKILHDVADGKVNVLFMTPEALENGAFWKARGGVRLPPVAFACIDEVHCVIEQSHNFRTSYFRLSKILREYIGVQCILGLTATATAVTAQTVAKQFDIREENIIRGNFVIPDNLHLSVSCDSDKDKALIDLLDGPNFRKYESIIIYCTKKKQTERVAKMLQRKLQFNPDCDSDIEPEDLGASASHPKKRKKSSTSSRPKRPKNMGSIQFYHSDMKEDDRQRVQDGFMNDRVRIVVATLAFGMGLNKSDVRGVIHYNMPTSLELFVQEIGRAGRDGECANCHVFIDEDKVKDLYELRCFAYNNTTELTSLKKLVDKAFSLPMSPSNEEIVICVEEMKSCLEINEECVSTLICYLEQRGLLEIIDDIKNTCTIICGGGLKLTDLAQKCPALDMAIRMCTKKDNKFRIKFCVSEVAACMDEEPRAINLQLAKFRQSFQQTNDDEERESDDSFSDEDKPANVDVDMAGEPKISSQCNDIKMEFSDRIYYVRPNIQDLSPDNVCDFLKQSVSEREEEFLENLYLLHSVLGAVSRRTHDSCYDITVNDEAPDMNLGQLIERYFGSDGLSRSYLCDHLKIPMLPLVEEVPDERREEIVNNVFSLINIIFKMRKDHVTARTIARWLQGIPTSVNFSSYFNQISRFRFKYKDINFIELSKIAAAEIKKLQ